MIINGDTLQPTSGNNILIPDRLGFQIGNTQIASFNSTGGLIAQQPYWNIVEQQASGTNSHAGAEFTQGDWRTRILNTTIGSNTITGSSLLNNQFTLPSGTYRLNARCPAYAVGFHKAILFNVTDQINQLNGSSVIAHNTTGADQTDSIILGIFTILSQKTFEIRHRCSSSRAPTGFGGAVSFGIPEIYTQVELWKLG